MAGVDVGTAYLTVVPSAKGFAGNLQRELGSGMSAAGKRAGSDAADGFGSSFKSGVSNVAKAGALLLAGAAAGGVAFVKGSISEAREAQKVGAITEQIIKSTGGVAKVTAAQVGDLATAISNKTGVDDEAIQAGANMLLTFKNVRNEAGKGADVFDRATKAAADLSAAGFGDMAGQSKMLGKALNDPVKGISALSRSGVTFTEQQKAQIKTLVASGKTLEAQKIILGEVESQVGGTAEASATAGEKLATAWGNFKEGIGTSLLPLVDKLATFLKDRLLPGAQGIIDIFAKGKVTDNFAKAFKIEDESKLADFLFRVRDGLKAVSANVKEFVAGFKSGEGAGGAFRENLAKLVDIAKELWPSLKDIAKQLYAAHKAVGISTWSAFQPIIAALPGILESLAPLLASVAKFMGENKELVGALVAALGAGIAAFKILSPIVKAYTVVQGLLNVVMTANPIGLVVVALAALAAGLIYAYNNSETFRSYVTTAFSMVKIGALTLARVAVTAFQFLANVWLTVVGALLDGAATAFGWVPGIGPKLQGAATEFGKFKTAANTQLDAIKNDLQVNINTELASVALEELHREFINKGWTVTAEVNTRMVYAGAGQLVPAPRATGGPVSAGGVYAVGDNPDGSWNRTTELLVPSRPGTVVNQEQIAAALGGRSGGLSQSDIDRLAYAFSQVQVKASISAHSVSEALVAGM
jgi:acid phosphatase family membrane protein YuiD